MTQPADRGVRPEQLDDQCCGLRVSQRSQGDALGTGHPAERPGVFGAVGDQHQRGGLGDDGEELGEHGFADLVDPVGVLDDIDHPGFAGQRGGVDQRGQPPPPGIGIDLGQRDLRVGDAQQILEQQHVLGVSFGD